VPPVDRPERNRHEYEVIFRSLLASPGVSLTANSQSIAQRYAQWLQIDPHRIDIIRNGWHPPVATPDERSSRQSQEFDALNPDAAFTVGSVFRFDDNKRPFLWLDAAAQLLERAPDSRFILVGDGPLLESAKDYAGRLGIAKRVLFTGRSSVVGFWLSKMDVFLLLSRFEGLPNALIEAQFAGLPVVTTDAGGAAETIIPGTTGSVLPNAETPVPADIAGAVLGWRRDPAGRAKVAAAAIEWADTTFSVEAMLRRTVRVYMSQG
jgi:glycosyltransferase involved in cell wall biosynthesis